MSADTMIALLVIAFFVVTAVGEIAKWWINRP